MSAIGLNVMIITDMHVHLIFLSSHSSTSIVCSCAFVISVKSNINSALQEIRKHKYERPIFPKQNGLLLVGGVGQRAMGMVEIAVVEVE